MTVEQTQAGQTNSTAPQQVKPPVECYECDTEVAHGKHTIVCLACNPELTQPHQPCGRPLWDCNCEQSPFP